MPHKYVPMNQGVGAPVAPPPPDAVDEGAVPDWLQHVLAGIIRVGGTAAGAGLGSLTDPITGPAGTIGGGALGGALSEALAEKVEPGGLHKDVNKGRVAVQGALGAVPGSWLIKSGKPLYNAGAGAALAYAGMTGNKVAEGQPLSEAVKMTGPEMLMGPVLGAGLGAGIGKAFDLVHGTKAPAPPPPQTEYKGVSGLRVALDKLKNTPQDAYLGNNTDIPLGEVPPMHPIATDADTIAAHRALAREQAKNPRGPIASEIGPPMDVARYDADKNPVWKSPSRAEMEKIHGDAMAGEAKTAIAVDKAQNAALKEKVDLEKAATAAQKLKAGEQKAATSVLEKEFKNSVQNKGRREIAADKLRRSIEVARDRADTEDLARSEAAVAQANAERQAVEMDRLRRGMPVEKEPTSISETISAPGEHGGTSKATFRREPEPPPDAEGGGGSSGGGGEPPTPYSGDPSILPSRQAAANTIYRGFRKAEAHGRALGAKDVVKVPGGWMIRFDDIEPPAPSGPRTTPPTGPSTPPESGGGGAAPLDKLIVSYKTYRNKVQAQYIAQETGGTVKQVGPRAYRVEFPKEAPEPNLPSAEGSTVSTIELPQPSNPAPKKFDAPRINPEKSTTADGGVRSLDEMRGGLTPDEFREYMDLRPNGPNGRTRTPEMDARLKELVDKMEGRTAPDEDAGFAAFSDDVDKLAAEEAADQPPLTVPEFAQALTQEGNKPIADVPFTLEGGTPPAPKPAAEPSLLDIPAEPEAPTQPGAAPIRLFKNQAEAAGANYGEIKAAKQAGEPVPEEGRAVAGRAAQRTAREQAANTSLDDIAQMPPEQQDQVLQRAVAAWKNQKGAISPMVLARLGLGGAGALAGAAAHPDDPLAGAIIGASAGFMTPSVVRALAMKNMAGGVGPETAKEAAEKIAESAKNFFRMMPDYQRFALLTKPSNLMINMWVGPYGAAVMGAIEHTLAGDERGLAALKLLKNPATFMKRWKIGLEEAESLLSHENERTEGQLGNLGPAWWRHLSIAPGRAMTAGDLASRDILMEAGFTESEARRITLTSEPYTPPGIGISKFKKGARTEGGKTSWLVNMMLPFYRTATNQMEQSAERTPILGFLAQNSKDVPDPLKMQIIQQAMGGGVGVAAFTLGMVVPPEQGRMMRKLIGDFGGQYGIVASTAFMMGQAQQQGKSKLGALGREVVQRDIPVPTTDFFATQFGIAKNLSEGQLPQRGPIPLPGFMQWGEGSDPLSIPNLIPMAQAATMKASGQVPQKQPYRYVPLNKR